MNQIEIKVINKYRPINLNALVSYFLKFLHQLAFGTFAKPHEPTHNQIFAKEPNFAHRLNMITTLKEYNYGR
jgi:hypothetical protein